MQCLCYYYLILAFAEKNRKIVSINLRRLGITVVFCMFWYCTQFHAAQCLWIERILSAATVAK